MRRQKGTYNSITHINDKKSYEGGDRDSFSVIENDKTPYSEERVDKWLNLAIHNRVHQYSTKLAQAAVE